MYWPSSWSHFVAIPLVLFCFVGHTWLVYSCEIFMHFVSLREAVRHQSRGRWRVIHGDFTDDAIQRFSCSTVAVGETNCKQPAKPQRSSLFLTISSEQPDTLSNAINNCVQLIRVSLCPLYALLQSHSSCCWLRFCFFCQLNLWSFRKRNNQ